MSQNLVSVPEKFVSLKTCQQQYANIRRVTDDMLCAGSGGKDMCKVCDIQPIGLC